MLRGIVLIVTKMDRNLSLTECVYFLLKQTEYICDQITVCNCVIKTDAHGHDKSVVFNLVSTPIDDRRKKQISVRQLNIQ